MEATQGVYVRYPAEELYAILALESHRHKAIIVGEDLGTVPPYVRPAMRKHGIQSMYVLHYELASNPGERLPPVPLNSASSLNTHDMPPFAAFWQGLDIEQRKRVGLLDKKAAEEEKKELVRIKRAFTAYMQDRGFLFGPNDDAQAVLEACLSFLAASRSRVVLVNLEDLWLEKKPQNIPSTKTEYHNWQRRARYSLEQFCQLPQVIDTLHTIDWLREQRKAWQCERKKRGGGRKHEHRF
jgi:4-alpha-glucanotransferase